MQEKEVLQKLEELGKKLKVWAKDNKGKRSKKKDLVAKLKCLNNEDPDDERLEEILEVKVTLNMEANKEIFQE